MNNDSHPSASPASSPSYGCIRDRQSSALAGVVVIGFGIFVVGIGPSEIYTFIEPMSIAMVGGITYGVLLIGLSLSGTLRAAGVLLAGRAERPEDVALAIQFCNLGLAGSVLGGVLSSLIGIINMLKAGMDDPNALSLGMAIALLTSFYGLLLALFFVAGRVRAAHLPVEDGGLEQDGNKDSSPPAFLWWSLAFAAWVLGTTCVLGLFLVGLLFGAAG